MMKIKTILRIIYVTFLVVAQITFLGCKGDDDPDDTKIECLPSPPTEIGLTSIDTLSSNEKQYTFGWSTVAQAEAYKFTLEIDGEIEHTETTQNNEIKRVLQLGENEVKFKVQSICEDGMVSETIEDVVEFLFTIAAVEVVYKKQNQTLDVTEICSSKCDYVKFGSATTGNFCEADISRFAYYYFSNEDFCACATNDCGTDSFIDCIRTKNKQIFGSEKEDCQ